MSPAPECPFYFLRYVWHHFPVHCCWPPSLRGPDPCVAESITVSELPTFLCPSYQLLSVGCRHVSHSFYSFSLKSVRRISVPFAAVVPLDSPSPPFFSRALPIRCNNDVDRLSDRLARTYLHVSTYSLSQFFLISVDSLLTTACVSLPIHPSVLNTRWINFCTASRHAWMCLCFLVFFPFCSVCSVYHPL